MLFLDYMTSLKIKHRVFSIPTILFTFSFFFFYREQKFKLQNLHWKYGLQAVSQENERCKADNTPNIRQKNVDKTINTD